MLKTNKKEKKVTSKFDKWSKANKKSNIYILLISIGMIVRLFLYLYFGARFVIDVTFVISVLLLLVLITNKFNYKEPKESNFRTSLKWFKVIVLVTVIAVFYTDTFIAGRDIHTIVSNTEEDFVYSYDLVGDGRRYFTTSSEDIEKVERFTTYELSNGKIKYSYFIESETGQHVDEEGNAFIKD